MLENRLTNEGNVIACIYADPLLLDESQLTARSFLTQDGIFYYSLAQMIRKKGFSSFDEVTILSNISKDVEVGFSERGGWDVIQHMIEIINTKNWETYLDILYRENILINLFNNGFNLTKPIDIKGKLIEPIQLFRHMTSEQVIDWYDSKITSLGTGYSDKILENEEIDFDDKFIKNCESGVERGTPFSTCGIDVNGKEIECLPHLSKQIDGFMDGTLSVIGGYSSVGKSNLLTTICMGLMYNGRKILIVSNEQQCKIFKINFVIWILAKYFNYYHLTKSKLKMGDFDDNDKIMIHKAQAYWREHYLHKIRFIEIPDANMSLLRKIVRQYVLVDGFDTVIYDTLKLDFGEAKDKKEYLSLIKDTRELDKIAKKYNIIVLCTLQLAINTTGKLFLDASVLSMSKQMKETLEVLILMRSVYAEELNKDNKRYNCRPFRRKKINGKWMEVEYEPDLKKTYRMLFIDKNRNKENSTDTGIAQLLRYDGSHGIFTEESFVRPHHGYIT